MAEQGPRTGVMGTRDGRNRPPLSRVFETVDGGERETTHAEGACGLPDGHVERLTPQDAMMGIDLLKLHRLRGLAPCVERADRRHGRDRCVPASYRAKLPPHCRAVSPVPPAGTVSASPAVLSA